MLPLVPPYLTFIAGTTIEELAEEEPRAQRDVLIAALFLRRRILDGVRGAGRDGVRFRPGAARQPAMAVLDGGHSHHRHGPALPRRVQAPLPLSRKRMDVEKPVGLWALCDGLAFAFGWTPCIGPILAAILAVASSEETVARGARTCSPVYSFGLGMPFLLAALAIEPFMNFLKGFSFTLRQGREAGRRGAGRDRHRFPDRRMQTLSIWLLETFPGLAKLG